MKSKIKEIIYEDTIAELEFRNTFGQSGSGGMPQAPDLSTITRKINQIIRRLNKQLTSEGDR